MVLQSTGAISLANIQTEFGGANPIGLNEYYLNGVYTTGTGAVGIPTSGQISLSQFYGKSKVVSSVPTAVATNFVGTYLNPFAGGSTSYEAISGCSGSNTSRTGVSTFNNIGTQGRTRTNVIYYASLILQARAGDVINISVNIVPSSSGDPEGVRIYINFGAGYGNIYTNYPVYTTNGTYGTNYTIPAGTAAGNYGICCTLEYSTTGATYRSVNLYSLHIY
jgi:hypothetical protein